MREASDKWEGGIGIGGRVVTNLRYGDDTTLIEIMERVRKTSEKAGLKLFKCPKDEGRDYRRYWRGDSGWENRGGGNELHISRSIDNKTRNM